MVTLNDYNNINDVLFLKGKQVYSLREYVKEILPEDLIGYDVIYEGVKQGKVKYIMQNKVQEILVTDTNKKILFLKEFINNIDDNKRKLLLEVCLMRIDILSIFPHMFDGFLNESIIKRAIQKKIVEINIHDFREFSKDPHKK